MAKRIDDDFGTNPYWELDGGPFIDTLPSAVSGERKGIDLGSLGAGMVVEGMNLPEAQLPINPATAAMVSTVGDTSSMPVQMGPMQRSTDVEDIIGMVPPIEVDSDLGLGIGEVGRQPASQLTVDVPRVADQNTAQPTAEVSRGESTAPAIETESGPAPIPGPVGTSVEESSDRGVPPGATMAPDVAIPPAAPTPPTTPPTPEVRRDERSEE